MNIRPIQFDIVLLISLLEYRHPSIIIVYYIHELVDCQTHRIEKTQKVAEFPLVLDICLNFTYTIKVNLQSILTNTCACNELSNTKFGKI